MRLIDADLLGLTDMEIIMCDGDYKEALKMLIDKIEHAPTIEERKWIPCSERLPEEEEDFLVTDGESMAVGYYRQDAKAWDSTDFGWIENREKGYGINEVVAWMPLPYPYRKDGD